MNTSERDGGEALARAALRARFPLWEARVMAQLGLCRDDLRALRQAHLVEGVDWVMISNRIMLSEPAVEKLRGAVSALAAGGISGTGTGLPSENAAKSQPGGKGGENMSAALGAAEKNAQAGAGSVLAAGEGSDTGPLQKDGPGGTAEAGGAFCGSGEGIEYSVLDVAGREPEETGFEGYRPPPPKKPLAQPGEVLELRVCAGGDRCTINRQVILCHPPGTDPMNRENLVTVKVRSNENFIRGMTVRARLDGLDGRWYLVGRLPRYRGRW